MEIKKNRQLSLGEIIDWEIIREDAKFKLGRRVNNKTKIQVIEVYPHHVLFRILEPPFLKLDIQNVVLFQKGVYKDADRINPFVRVDNE